MTGTASVSGLISGIDTDAVLDQLYQLARAPIQRLESRKDSLASQSNAWASFEAKALAFQTAALSLSQRSAFDAAAAASSHSDLVTATASSDAAPGAYSFTVQSLAQTHQLASQGYADTDQIEVGTGTVSIQVGEGDPMIVDVDGYTLAELRDAINDAKAGVSASIINDGGDTSPYRLVLTSATSGLDGELAVTVDLAGGTAPTFSDLQAAQDAQIQLGSGSGAITVTSSTNTMGDAIEGVTLELLAADPAVPVTVAVSRDLEAIESRITDFIAKYNDIAGFFGEQFDYNEETGETGLLFSDYRLQRLQHELTWAVSNPVAAIQGEFAALSEVGIRMDGSGKLNVDSAELASALSDHLEDVAQLFSAIGGATHSDVTFLGATEQTRPSGAAGWEIDITQPAAQARVTAGVAQTESLVADETLTINGHPVALTAGMTQSDVVEAINEQQDLTGVTAAATDVSGEGSGSYLTLVRVAYGSSYGVEAVSTASNQSGSDTSGIGTVSVSEDDPGGESGAGTGEAGQDVDGTMGGCECTGSGRRLTAEEGDAVGINLLVMADAAGSYGSVTFTVGAAEQAFRAALSATDSTDGSIVRAQESLTDAISDVDAEIVRMEDLVQREQERLRGSFVAMERALAQFESQRQFLASQIAQMQANGPGGA